MKQSKGKGPFASKQRAKPKAKHWTAPPVKLSKSNVSSFLDHLFKRADRGIYTLFARLAAMKPAPRLARNLSETARCMAASPISDALEESITNLEHSALYQLERMGVSIELIGIAHGLLHIRERQEFIRRLGDAFVAEKDWGVSIRREEQ